MIIIDDFRDDAACIRCYIWNYNYDWCCVPNSFSNVFKLWCPAVISQHCLYTNIYTQRSISNFNSNTNNSRKNADSDGNER